MMAPLEAIRKVLRKAGWSLADVDLIELNEAFSVQAVAIIKELGLDPARVNVNGGAVALGHAIGQSGSRLLTTMLYELKRRDAHRGIQSAGDRFLRPRPGCGPRGTGAERAPRADGLH